MRNFFLVMLLTAFSFTSFSQQSGFVISGKVVNAATKSPLQGASVFAENTTLGTATDAEGNFKLYLPNGGYELVVTFTGFNTETKRINAADATDKGLVLELNQKEKEMQVVSVVATGEVKDGWNKYGIFFFEQFIGKTTNSNGCTIKNKEDIKFFFSKKRNRLKVMSSEPLLIENNALGYTIKYALDSFIHEYASQVSVYTGNPLFEEMTTTDPAQQAAWAKARQQAYKGSVLHFMRSVFNQQLKEEGFEVQFVISVNGGDSALKLKNYYSALNYKKDDSLNTVEIRPNQNEVGVLYMNEKPAPAYFTDNEKGPVDFQFSVLSFLPQHSITVEQNGYFFEQNEITTNEYWTWERIADQVPYDYVPN